MSDEITIRTSLIIRKGNLVYSPPTEVTTADFNGTAGPTPGAFSVGLTAASVDFSKLNHYGGMVKIKNIDSTNNAEWGLLLSGSFYPIGQILPGEVAQFRFSPDLGEVDVGTGTGTHTGGGTFAMRAGYLGSACQVSVEAFDP